MAPELAPFAVVQSIALRGDIGANVGRHVRLAERAAHAGARFVLFPELALTGYEPELAAQLALTPDDPRLAPLRDVAVRESVTLVTGAPLRSPGHPAIAALSFLPDGSVHVYTKQYLHPGEERAFRAGTGGAPLALGNVRVALAVCAEIAHAGHAAAAAQSGAGLYAASVLVSEGGYAADAGLLQGYARTHRMPVAMANHGGPTGGWASAGRSAVWDENGEVVVAAAGTGESVLLAERSGGVWRGRTLDA
jgi:predicted amidohydrolase